MWLFITILANFFNGAVYLADKYFLSKKVQSAISYTFYVCIWSIGNCVLFIFHRHIPALPWLLLDLAAGFMFMAALYFWYKALRQGETTRVVPIAGAFIPIFTLLLNYIIGRHGLTNRELGALIILIVGSALLSIQPKENQWLAWWIKIKRFLQPNQVVYRSQRRLIFNSLLASFIFASYYVFIKFLYDSQGFANSFIWIRLGSFVGALSLLIFPKARRLILNKPRRQKAIKSLPLFLLIRVIAFIAFVLNNFAIALADVSLVNSLQGLQYLFLLVIVLVLSKRYPKLIKKEVSQDNLWQKISGVVLITIGLFLLL